MHWEDSDLLERVDRVRLELADGSGADREVTKVRKSGRGYLVQFDGINDRNTAESLRGARVLVARSCLPEVGAGERYLSDLIGQKVFDPAGNLFGTVVEIATYPSVDSLVIERAGGGIVEQPFVDDWVEALGATPGRIVLRSLDGIVG